MTDLDYLYAHHAVGLCPEERCVAARANLAALVEVYDAALAYRNLVFGESHEVDQLEAWAVLDNLFLDRGEPYPAVASREGSGT